MALLAPKTAILGLVLGLLGASEAQTFKQLLRRPLLVHTCASKNIPVAHFKRRLYDFEHRTSYRCEQQGRGTGNSENGNVFAGNNILISHFFIHKIQSVVKEHLCQSLSIIDMIFFSSVDEALYIKYSIINTVIFSTLQLLLLAIISKKHQRQLDNSFRSIFKHLRQYQCPNPLISAHLSPLAIFVELLKVASLLRSALEKGVSNPIIP